MIYRSRSVALQILKYSQSDMDRVLKQNRVEREKNQKECALKNEQLQQDWKRRYDQLQEETMTFKKSHQDMKWVTVSCCPLLFVTVVIYNDFSIILYNIGAR